jgi:hypothetical protein
LIPNDPQLVCIFCNIRILTIAFHLQLGYVTLFMQDYPDEPSWPYLDKLICQWRQKEEEARVACGEPPAPPYGRCRLFRDQEPTEEWFQEAGQTTPTMGPTSSPSVKPTPSPTTSPTDGPTPSPTDGPTPVPTKSPTDGPTPSPTKSPTDGPTPSPSSQTVTSTTAPNPEPVRPSRASRPSPDGSAPSPSASSSRGSGRGSSSGQNPVTQNGSPSRGRRPTAPTIAAEPIAPAPLPTTYPSLTPTTSPTGTPFATPTVSPTSYPTLSPTASPTAAETEEFGENGGTSIPPEIACSNYNVPGGYDRMCRSSWPCCDEERSNSNYCWNIYDNIFPGPAIESACHHCCPGKTIGPDKEVHPEGYEKTIQCSAYNSQRHCKQNGCCELGRSSSSFCHRQFATHTPNEWEQICVSNEMISHWK